ncbi:MAG: DNA mismatch repair protein MutS [bacterium]
MKTEMETPMMKQYLAIKKDYENAILFFRLGDFYEMFMEDAKTSSKILGITLTSRSKGEGKIPMCGVPYHSAENYIAKLTRAGFRVAICEQVSDPNLPGIVERKVIRVITPGTTTNENALDKNKNNYILSIAKNVIRKKETFAVSYCDLSTGDFYSGKIDFNLQELLGVLEPSEIILPLYLYNDPAFLKIIKNFTNSISYFDQWDYYIGKQTHPLVKTIKSSVTKESASALFGYLEETQKTNLNHITKISEITNPKYMRLDSSAVINLEIFKTFKDAFSKGSLISVLDKTSTAMGARTLRKFILNPLKIKKDIEDRLDSVNELIKENFLREKLNSFLPHVYDIERVLAKLSLGTANPKDLIALKYSLKMVLEIKSNFKSIKPLLLKKIEVGLHEDLLKVVDLIETFITEEPPFLAKEGGIIKIGVDAQLDNLKNQIKGSTGFLVEMENEERVKTNISSLKVRFNKVYGYYIEVSKSNLHLVPDYYIRKQTLVNAERFITAELKKHEDVVLNAKDLINQREYEIYLDVISKILEYTGIIKQASSAIGVLDVLNSFANLAIANNYKRPSIRPEKVSHLIHIENGRHPVIEKILPVGEFISNSVLLDNKSQILIITGPNMSGKSTFIRQTALMVLMAQIGCFVSAEKMELSPVDRIFTRIGAGDALSSGLSTFMVEMMETANILNNATEKSLVILDEVGRGTSTYDGVSIAWAIVEYLAKKIKSKTLFATHYHELLRLSELYTSISNFKVDVLEEKDVTGEEKITFLYKIVSGGADKSYGIHVAKLAGLPNFVIRRAYTIIKLLEQRKIEKPKESLASNDQLTIDL